VRIAFVVQEDPSGTAHATLAAEGWCDGAPFVAMNSDNLYPVETLRALAELDEPGLAVFEKDDLIRTSNIPPERVQAFALLEVDANGYLTRIDEKPPADRVESAGPHAAVSMNCWRFDARIFEACRRVARSARGEFELPQAVARAIDAGVRFRAVPAKGPVLDLSRRTDAADVSRRLAGVVPRP
jgi:glucose-1-phosphate thymidylyltransferase